ncbi:MAG: acyl carrier protein [Acidimicrobiia bacterium]|nr:acyl carrier protein [Acidimicrobiia bacterium]
MTMVTRRRTIMDYVSAELLIDPEEGLDEHEEILASGRIDSMSVMRLVFFIKDEFSITIPNEDLVVENFQSIDALDRYLRRYGHD